MRILDWHWCWSLVVAAWLLFVGQSILIAADETPQAALARDILKATGVQGGLVVHLGCGDGRLTAALRASPSYLVQGLDADAQQVAKAREHVQGLGLYGPVSVGTWSNGRLPYVANLVNLLVVETAAPAEEEMLRVLAPGGVAYIRQGQTWKRIDKPRPKQIDQWTHYLHDATNNAVAQDSVVGPPQHYQWIGSPRYLRHHDSISGLGAMVSAAGRLFYIMDLGPRWAVEMPPQWTLIARDAFNGVVLWQRPVEKWHPHLWPLKRGPAQILRRLVAEGDRVYVTLGVGGPVSILSATTGDTLAVVDGTEGAEEIILSGDLLLVVVNPDLDAYKTLPMESVDTLRAAGRAWTWDEGPRRIVALDAATRQVRWSREATVAPSTLAIAEGRVLFYDGDKVVALDAGGGQTQWQSPPLARWKPMQVAYNPTLVVAQDVVLFSGGEKMNEIRGGNDTMTALSAKTGQTLWTAPHPGSGYASSEDLFVIDGLAWCGATTGPRDSGVFTGRDLHTGEVRREFGPDDWPHMPHHRCYRAKATSNFILTSRTGIEAVDLKSEHWTSNHWVRGSCNYGILPCNGLVYAPPHSCACYLLAKLSGFNALAAASPDRQVPQQVPDEGRLIVGPAQEAISAAAAPVSDDPAAWPTYRGDEARSGHAKTTVPSQLRQVWQADLGGRPTSPVVAEGLACVALPDAHRVAALDAASGKPRWTFTAGARIDSPPTIWQGRVLFGSADGWVYCLRASDGELAWRFRAAPRDDRLTAQEQLESVWPVSGSVLVHQGVAYCVAGRAMWLDGGLRMLRLDARTGRKLSEEVLDDKYPGKPDNLQTDIRWPNLPVALPDVLSCDGTHVYMRSQPFDLEGRRAEVITPRKYDEQQGPTAHLFSPTGFLDDSYWHRTYWLYGESFISGAGGWQLAAYRAPMGKILAMDENMIYGFGSVPFKVLGTANEYHLFGCPRKPEIILSRQKPSTRGVRVFGSVTPSQLKYTWSKSLPVMVRAIALTNHTLFVAGPPAMIDEGQLYDQLSDPALQAQALQNVAAFEGRKGALLMAASRADGNRAASYHLPSPPVFDGLAAASGCLFLSTMDGKLLCLGERGDALQPAPEADLKSIPASDSRQSDSTPTTSHPDFQHLSHVQIAPCELGYRVKMTGGQVGLAVKQLAAPIGKSVTFKVPVRLIPNRGPAKDDPTRLPPANGFLAFGDGPEDEQLIKCGLRTSGKTAQIAQGSLGGKNVVSKRIEPKVNEVFEMTVEVDLAAQRVRLALFGETLEAPLRQRLERISHLGYAVASVTCEFGPVEIVETK